MTTPAAAPRDEVEALAEILRRVDTDDEAPDLYEALARAALTYTPRAASEWNSAVEACVEECRRVAKMGRSNPALACEIACSNLFRPAPAPSAPATDEPVSVESSSARTRASGKPRIGTDPTERAGSIDDPTSTPISKDGDPFWVVENVRYRFYVLDEKAWRPFTPRVTTDIHQAQRFASKPDAEAFAATIPAVGDEWAAREHIIEPSPSAPATEGPTLDERTAKVYRDELTAPVPPAKGEEWAGEPVVTPEIMEIIEVLADAEKWIDKLLGKSGETPEWYERLARIVAQLSVKSHDAAAHEGKGEKEREAYDRVMADLVKKGDVPSVEAGFALHAKIKAENDAREAFTVACLNYARCHWGPCEDRCHTEHEREVDDEVHGENEVHYRDRMRDAYDAYIAATGAREA